MLVVDSLLRDEDELSDVARSEWGKATALEMKRERRIAGMAIENILSNIERLVQRPITQVTNLASVSVSARQFKPDAIVLSGTLRDFDYYNPEVIETFAEFIRETRTPVLAICGGHQLVGLGFGAKVITWTGSSNTSSAKIVLWNTSIVSFELPTLKIPSFAG